MFRPRPRDRRPRPRRKEEEVKEEPKARLDFFVSLPNLEDICTDDANDDERFLRGERRRTEGILFRRRLNRRRRLGWICLFLFLLLAKERECA